MSSIGPSDELQNWINGLAEQLADARNEADDLRARVKRLQRLVCAYDGTQYTDPGSIISAADDVEKQAEYELARQDCEQHGDLEDER